jgi:hypothetical protein
MAKDKIIIDLVRLDENIMQFPYYEGINWTRSAKRPTQHDNIKVSWGRQIHPTGKEVLTP